MLFQFRCSTDSHISLCLADGDIVPESWYEQAFALVLMLAGGAIYAFLVGAVSSIVSGFDRATQ